MGTRRRARTWRCWATSRRRMGTALRTSRISGSPSGTGLRTPSSLWSSYSGRRTLTGSLITRCPSRRRSSCGPTRTRWSCERVWIFTLWTHKITKRITTGRTTRRSSGSRRRVIDSSLRACGPQICKRISTTSTRRMASQCCSPSKWRSVCLTWSSSSSSATTRRAKITKLRRTISLKWAELSSK